MILRLLREQFRSQRRYTVWAAAVLTLGLAVSTFALVSTATQIAHNDSTEDVNLYSHRYELSLYSFTNGNPGGVQTQWMTPQLSLDEVAALIEDSSWNDSLTVIRQFGIETGRGGYEAALLAVATPVDWENYLLEGHAPGRGEIVLNSDFARESGWSIGDTIHLSGNPEYVGDAPTLSFTLVGLVRSGGSSPYSSSLTTGYISWDDSITASGSLQNFVYADPETGESTAAVTTTLLWDDDIPALAPYASDTHYQGIEPGMSLNKMHWWMDDVWMFMLLFSAFAIVGIVVAAFAMGRSQAEARTQWVASARVLGATRRSIALTSTLETALVAATAIIVGIGTGYLAVSLHLAMLRTLSPEAFLPGHPSLPAVVVGLVAGIGILVSVVVVAVPAYWAAHISPVAALKPVAPMAERTAPRKAHLRWILIPMTVVVLGAFTSWVIDANEGPDRGVLSSDTSKSLAVIAAVIGGFAFFVDVLPRLLRVIGTRLARGRRPWAIAAGDGLVTHTRMYVYASLSMAVVVGVFGVILTSSALNAIDWRTYRGWGEPPMLGFGEGIHQNPNEFWGFLVASMLTATGVALAITLSSERTGAAETATRAALGMSYRDGRVAAGVRHVIPLGLGIAVGGLLGWLVPLAVRIAQAAVSPDFLVNSLGWNLRVAGDALLSTVLLALVALAFSLAGALVVAASSRERTPVEALRPAGKVSVR